MPHVPLDGGYFKVPSSPREVSRKDVVDSRHRGPAARLQEATGPLQVRGLGATQQLAFLGIIGAANAVLMIGMSWVFRAPEDLGRPAGDFLLWRFWVFTYYLPVTQFLLFYGIALTVFSCSQHGQKGLVDVEPMPPVEKRPFLWMMEPMRMIAALHIVYYHDTGSTQPVGARWGYCWTSFFMVLSGFMGGYQILTSDPDLSRTTTFGYLYRRVLRLWPSYLIFLFLSSVPKFWDKLWTEGNPFPDMEGSLGAIAHLATAKGMVYVTGLQTLIPLDPSYMYIDMKSWFVSVLLVCEALVPSWLRCIVALQPLRASSGKVWSPTMNGMLLGASILAFVVACAEASWLHLGRSLVPEQLRNDMFLALRFSPFSHWAQVLLGVVLARAFVGAQATEEPGAPPPPTRVAHWFGAALLAAGIACLCMHIAMDKVFFRPHNMHVVFINSGAAAPLFAILIVSLAQASVEMPAEPRLARLAAVVGDAAYPTYLFMKMYEYVLLYQFETTLHLPEKLAHDLSFWLRAPFLILVTYATGVLWNALRPLMGSDAMSRSTAVVPMAPKPSSPKGQLEQWRQPEMRYEEMSRERGLMGTRCKL